MSTDRAATILARFNAAHASLISKLRGLPPGSAEGDADAGSWNAAQIGCHVAMANDWTAGVLTGETPLAEPVPPGFAERFDADAGVWNVKTFPLDPPVVVGSDHAIERLKASSHHLSKAIATLTPERGSGYCVTLPIGRLSLFELADFAVAHVDRHAAQLGRPAAKSY